ncbi:hypothetical protein Tco_0606731 [Tanacetum coccineum]
MESLIHNIGHEKWSHVMISQDVTMSDTAIVNDRVGVAEDSGYVVKTRRIVAQSQISDIYHNGLTLEDSGQCTESSEFGRGYKYTLRGQVESDLDWELSLDCRDVNADQRSDHKGDCIKRGVWGMGESGVELSRAETRSIGGAHTHTYIYVDLTVRKDDRILHTQDKGRDERDRRTTSR